MEIAIIGAGVVGQATGKGFTRLGHKVTFYDLNDEATKKLREEGYNARFHDSCQKTDKSYPYPYPYDVVFVCVPEDCLELDLWKEWYTGLFVIRSTVPLGTTRLCDHVCHNPEFLREAVAEYEFMNPDKIIIGECCKTHGDVLVELYEPFHVPIVRVDTTTSELIKLASNAYLATQISFWNQIKLIADKLGVNSHVVGKACSLDPRISNYGASMHGLAYGGRCLVKDMAQLKQVAMKLGVHTALLDAVQDVNNNMKVRE